MIDTSKYEGLINMVCFFVENEINRKPIQNRTDEEKRFMGDVNTWLKENTHFNGFLDVFTQVVDTWEGAHDGSWCKCTDAMLKEHGPDKVAWLEGRVWQKKINENFTTGCKKCYPQEVIE
jgi:hypothetical protein